MKTIKELRKEVGELNEKIISVEKPSDDHTILMMTHSSLCGEVRGLEEVLEVIDELELYGGSSENPCISIKELEQKITGDKNGYN